VIYTDILKKLRELHIPPIYYGGADEDQTLLAKLFFPDFSWIWYVIEFDGEDMCYGLVDREHLELGSFRLSELAESRGKLGLPLELDLNFEPTPLYEML